MIRAMMLPLGIVGALAAAGCDRSGTIPTSASTDEAKAIAPAIANAAAVDTGWARTCPIPSDAPREPIGRTAAALAMRYGPPAAEERFVLGEALDPVRMSVRNVLPAPGDLRRDIREMTWHARGCGLTVWLTERGGRETAIATMRAPTGGES